MGKEGVIGKRSTLVVPITNYPAVEQILELSFTNIVNLRILEKGKCALYFTDIIDLFIIIYINNSLHYICYFEFILKKKEREKRKM